MNFLNFVKAEFKQLLANRFTRIALITVCGIPLLYSFLYLYAFWNPYGKLTKLPIAVVNQDQGKNYQGAHYNFGNQLVKSLKTNRSAQWRFVSWHQAAYGLEHRKYYMVIKVPSDFSNKVLSVNSTNPTHANLDFIANQGSNYLASQIGSRIVGEIKDTLAKQISQQYVENIFSQIRDTSTGLAQAGDGAQQLSNGIVSALDGTRKLTNGLEQTKDATYQLVNGANKMVNGANALTVGLNKTSQASKTMAAKTEDVQKGLRNIDVGLQDTENGSATLEEKLGQAAQGAQQMSERLAKAGSATNKLAAGGKQVYEGTTQITSSMDKLTQGLTTLANSAEQNLTEIKKANDHLDAGSSNLLSALQQLQGNLDAVASGADNSQQGIKTASEKLNSYISEHPEAAKDSNVSALSATLTQLASDQGINAVSSGLHQSSNALTSQLIPAAKQINLGQKQLGNGLTELNSTLKVSLVGDSPQQLAIIPSLNLLKHQMEEKVNPALVTLTQQTANLAQGISSLEQGSKSLYEGIQLATQKLSQLSSGASQLKAGNDKLLAGTQLLQKSLLTLADSQANMAQGANSLTSGLQQSASGLGAIDQGLTTLKDGQNHLGLGLADLKQGATTLSQKLYLAATNAKEETLPTVVNQKSTMIAHPINLQDDSIHKVNLYGSGFAPYFIPLSLWVGAIMIFFVVNARKTNKPTRSNLTLALGKYFTAAVISSGQALLTSFVIRNVLHLSVTSAWRFYGFNILLSLVFVAIIQFLISAFGIAGRFIALVLLMLQLTSAGGTFPIELIPRFFQILNPLLPMSYSVAGLREIISGANATLLPGNIVILGGFGLSFLILTILSYITPLLAKLNLPDEVI